MPYATPAQFAAHYGSAQTARLLDRSGTGPAAGGLNADLLARAIAGDAIADVSATERQRVLDALARLDGVLTEATQTIDSYLATITTLPLPAEVIAANPLAMHCRALARRILADTDIRRTDAMDADCEAAMMWLKAVAAGRARLLGLTETAVTPPGGSQVFVTGGTGIDWNTY